MRAKCYPARSSCFGVAGWCVCGKGRKLRTVLAAARHKTAMNVRISTGLGFIAVSAYRGSRKDKDAMKPTLDANRLEGRVARTGKTGAIRQ